MIVTDAAATRLKDLLRRTGSGDGGFRITGIVGTCRGSAPILQPASCPADSEVPVHGGGLVFFVGEELVEILETATLDHDGRLFGRGLCLSWPHREGGCPNCR